MLLALLDLSRAASGSLSFTRLPFLLLHNQQRVPLLLFSRVATERGQAFRFHFGSPANVGAGDSGEKKNRFIDIGQGTAAQAW
jgi:hypothetical protein